MCGRFALRLDRPHIRRAIPDAEQWLDEDHFVPRYNVAPRTYSPVIRRARSTGPANRDHDSEDTGSGQALVLHSMKWGLVPHWSKVEDKSLSTTNARSENLVDGGGMWASIKGKNRCAVVCQGYYEWLTKGKEKLPHFIKRNDGQLMLMAGLYDHAIIDGQPLWTFTIVTTDACCSFGWLHDRQPVMLFTQDTLHQWLDTSTQSWTPELTKLVQPYDDKVYHLKCYQVPKEVGKVGNESPSFIQPVKERKDGIQAMFQKQIQTAAKRKRTESPPVSSSTPADAKEAKTEQEQDQQKKIKSDISSTSPPSPRKRATKCDISSTPPPSPRKRATKASTPKKSSAVPEKGKITSFFRKTTL